MQFTNAFLFTSLLAFVSTASGASGRHLCGSPSLEYRNIGCNTCVDPANDWWGARVFDIGDNQRVSMHNQDRCTPGSQVGQWYGNVCARAGATALRSVWIACPGQKLDNGTENADAEGKLNNADSDMAFISLE
ncbi:hypothetical protein BDQ17DRAFT_1351536 [Cyathus striatus]|nr:hypothetical protein BDQ17DRAFT_1351536 [Cyathus striatus]